MSHLNFRHTVKTIYLANITGAIINNFSPLLFLTFQRQFGISIGKISFLITLNFGIQMLVDFLGAKFGDRLGYRRGAVCSQLIAAAGMIGLGILPFLLPAYPALLFCTALCAIGSGLNEVLLSPMLEALPGDAKASAMGIMHSFYCWGHVAVILISTVYFQLAGTANWRWLAIGWAIIPLCAAALFFRVPINSLGEPETNLPMRRLFSLPMFWVLLALMLASGAAEQAMAQWASLFAELGLGVSKAMGDLLGPCLFAVAMGTTRLLYGKFGERFRLPRLLGFSAALCTVSFLIVSLVPDAIVSLLGCGLCGVSVAILWPGVLSLSARDCPQGGTAMFALLALAGDVGCFVGPDLVGVASDALGGGSSGVKLGMLAALVFPAMLFAALFLLRRMRRKAALS